MSLLDLINIPSEPVVPSCKKSYWILNTARETAAELLYLFDHPNGKKRGPGNPSNTDQDLLRSMLIFAGAGFDAAIKQLIKDVFRKLIRRDSKIRDKAIKHFAKTLSRRGTDGFEDITRWLFHSAPSTAMANDLIKELTSDSLQSKEQLEKVIGYLQLEKANVLIGISTKDLENAFRARNLIIHELDVDFSIPPAQGKRTRTQRHRKDMVSYTNVIFKIASSFMLEVEGKLL